MRVVLLAIFAILIVGCVPPPTEESAGNELAAQIENEESTESDILDAHPTSCKPVHGFDSYRTEQAFAINPQNSLEMYVSIEYKGLFKSSDGGQTWKLLEKGIKAWPRADNPKLPCYSLHFSLHIDSTNPSRILFPGGASPGRISEEMYKNGGLHESLDSGESWHQLLKGDMNAFTGRAVTDPRNPKVIYVDTAAVPASYTGADPNEIFVTKGIVYKTTDGGETWEELPTGIAKDLRSTNLFLNKANPDQLIMTTMSLPVGTGTSKKVGESPAGILISADGGKTWTKGGPANLAVRNSDVSPNFKNVFISGDKDEQEVNMYSVDGGKTLTEVKTPINFAKFNPHDPKGLRLLGFSLYVNSRSLFESQDGGITWNSIGKLPDGVSNEHRLSNIVWDPKDKEVIYVTGDMGRVWKSSDGGKTWTLILSVELLGEDSR